MRLLASYRALRACAFALAATLLLACGAERERGEVELPGLSARQVAGLEAIQRRGVLRIARTRWQGFDTLPRQGIPVERYHALAERFAASLGVEPEWVIVDRFDGLFPALLTGRADLVAANVTVTRERQREVAFSVPLTSVDEWVIAREGVAIESLEALAGRTVGIPAHAAYRESLRSYEALAGLEPVVLPSGATPGEVADRLVAQDFEATVMDDNTAREILRSHDRLTHAFTLPARRNLAWAVRPDNDALRTRLDEFLTAWHVRARRNTRDLRDLPGIRETGRLRMLTVDGPGSYYLWRGELMGFDYELVRDFARAQQLELEVVVAPDVGTLIPWLLEGRGDLVASTLTITPDRRAQGVEFTRPYLHVDQVLVAPGDRPVPELSGLDGRTVSLNPSTSFWTTLTGLQQRYRFELQPVRLGVDALIAGVEDGDVDLTVADSHIAGIEAAFRDGITLGPVVSAGDDLGWAVHADHEQLLTALNAYLKKIYRGERYNVIRNKYFHNERRAGQLREHRVTGGRLSPYDDLVRLKAMHHGFDWRLIVSQMYQESQFNPGARSRSGALGLMQVVPRTARELGIDPAMLADPEIGIEAGVRYLAWTRQRFPETLPVDQQMWFSLAAYNAGVGHVRDARRLARRLGNDPNAWFGSVEKAMRLLADKRYAKDARHGWVRGSEPVRYVTDIRRRYEAYLAHLEGAG